MKIALINFTYNKKSGIENVADSTLREIDRLDHDNNYILFVNKASKDYYISSSRIEKKVVRMAGSQIAKTLWLLCIYPLYALIKGVDITVVFNCSSNFAFSPFTRNIIYIHDLGELKVKNKYDLTRMIYRKYVSLPVNTMFGDVFVVVSEFTRKDVLNHLKIDKNKVKLIYNGTDNSIKKEDKVSARQYIASKYNIKDSAKILISIGRIDPVGKNLLKLVEAADILRKRGLDFHLFLIGEANFPNAHLVPEDVQQRRLNEHITLPGYLDTGELNTFYNAADALVFPSIYEGFGLPLLEAMKCDLPVICSDIDVFHEVAGEAAIYFDPCDALDMADKIDSLIQDPDHQSLLIKCGKERVSLFTWERAAVQLIDIMKHC